MAILDRISWTVVVLAVLFMGLAPLRPMPHIWQKLTMLMNGTLRAPVDIVDLLMHTLPWVLLATKTARTMQIRNTSKT